ncbi:response regulator [Palleronia caenipelagi]|uniref:DNA-binding transcriptional regulator NtrC n=1 Tax=Palleronia caenipelagi TaxID=2489174 RepID=A0A547PNJ0_9RHOB|nr:response regulator [Palleronia caenipelagi]TRD15723.1 response regulator [Palleronia caenipelagi]
MDGTVLVADDDRTIRTVLTQALTRAGCKVHATSSLVTLLRWVEEGKGDLLITDVMMPDGNGLEALPQIRQQRPDLPVIVISAQNTIKTAIQATEADAYDYLPKPFDLPDLMKRAGKALDLPHNAPAAKPERPARAEFDLPLVGRTMAMQTLYRLVARVVNAEIPLLISGESGTGKSLVARAVHDFSDRRNLPFVAVTRSDLAQIETPEALLSRARGGTLVFEEVSDLPDAVQLWLVQMLDRLGETPPRIMATSQLDLAQEMEAGRFRPDLYYRIAGVSIPVPALRERIDDIPLLFEHFLRRAEADGAPVRTLGPGAEALFRRYSWPGNVRQLENIVRRLALAGDDGEIGRDEAEQILASQPAVERVQSAGSGEGLQALVAAHIERYFAMHGDMLPPPGLYQRFLREIERPLIEISLDATAGNQAQCAQLLGINRNTLRKKITDLDILVTRRRKLM